MAKDKYGQEVKEGDWIAAPLPGGIEVAIGKVCGFTKNGNPRFKQGSRMDPQTCMLRTVYSKTGFRMDAKFVKVEPTREIDLYYDRH